MIRLKIRLWMPSDLPPQTALQPSSSKMTKKLNGHLSKTVARKASFVEEPLY